MKFVAICPHDAGAFQAQEHEITDKTIKKLRDAAQARCSGGRYVSRIEARVDGRRITVYTESGGWRITDATDEARIKAL